MKRESFILYEKHLRNISKLTDEQAGRLLKAIYQHSQEEEVEQLDGATDMLYGIISDQMDEDAEKYQEVVEKRAKAGRASAEARANKKEQDTTNSTHVESVEQNSTNATDNVNDNVNGNDIENIYKSGKKKPIKHIYGQYKHVRLTNEQYNSAVEAYGKDETEYLIQEIDSYCERKKKTYNNYREAMVTFVRNGSLEEYAKTKKQSAEENSDLFNKLLNKYQEQGEGKT